MRRIERLRIDATRAAARRGHRLERFTYSTDRSNAIAYCRTATCRRFVMIDAHPLPNGIEIGGDAVALNCREQEQEQE